MSTLIEKIKGVLPVAQKNEHIFDKVFKRMLSLSGRSVTALINGLFNTDYPPDSKITYNSTENVSSELVHTVADVILTINDIHTYHLEAQTYKDDGIIFRVFDYGYRHAVKNAGVSKDTLQFPEPVIILFTDSQQFPEKYILNIDFGSQGIFIYEVPVYSFINMTIEEIESKNMVILLPLYILKLRKTIQKERTLQNFELLKSLIFDDIIRIIEKQLSLALITPNDALVLKQLLVKLYEYLYADYEELKQGGLNTMVEDAWILDMDAIQGQISQRYDKKLKEYQEEIKSYEEEIKSYEEKRKSYEEEIKSYEEERKGYEKERKDYEEKLHRRDRIILACKLLLNHVPIDEIASKTGLTEKEIKELK